MDDFYKGSIFTGSKEYLQARLQQMANDSMTVECDFQICNQEEKVLVRTFSQLGGPGKLLSYWEQQIEQ